MDNHSLLRSASHRWAPMVGLLAAMAAVSVEPSVVVQPECTAERAAEQLVGWLTRALRRSIHAPVHGL